MSKKPEEQFPMGSIVYLRERSCNAFGGMSTEDIVNVPMVIVRPSSKLYLYVRPADTKHPWYEKFPGTPLDQMYQYVRTDTVHKKEVKIDSSIEEAFL